MFNLTRKRPITKSQFNRQRESKSAVPLQTLLEQGWDIVECSCGKEGCEGWKLGFVGKPKLKKSGLSQIKPPDDVA